MATYKTIKELLLAEIRRTNGRLSFEEIAPVVSAHFPEHTQKWKLASTWSSWRNELAMRHPGELTEQETQNLYSGKLPKRRVPKGSLSLPILRGPRIKPQPDVAFHGNELLTYVRSYLDINTGKDETLRFALNRFVYARLQLDERKSKTGIKQALWENGDAKCNHCGEMFASLKGVELHRVNRTERYLAENCVLLCKPCHMKVRD